MKKKLVLMIFFLIGCGTLSLPSSGDIKSLQIKLNDPLNRKYWNYNKVINKKNWAEVLALFEKKPYLGSILSWQGLAVIEITRNTGEVVSIAVFDTGNENGCFQVDDGKYYAIKDEKLFYKKLFEIVNRD